MKTNNLIFSFVAATLLMSGCGGSKEPTTPDTNKVAISGKAVDGYLSGSVVWLDLNKNAKLDSGEPHTTTDSSGAYRLEVEDKNYDNVKVVVAGGKDVDTGAMFEGKLEAPFKGKPQKKEIVNITPISTLVTKLVEKGESIENAKQKVKSSLGLGQNTDILEDPKKLEEDGNSELITATLSLQKSIEMIAQAASGDDDQKVAALQNTLFEAFAQVLKDDDAGNIDGVDKILEKTKKKKITGVNDTHIDEAKDLTQKLENAIKDGKKSGEVEKIVEIIKDDKQKSFDTLIKEDTNSLEKSFLLYTLKKLHIQGDLSALADDLINAGIKDSDIKNPTKATLDRLKSDEKFRTIYSALKNEQKEMEDKKDEITSDAKDKYIPYRVGDTIYDFSVEKHYDGLEAEYGTFKLNSDHTVTDKVYDFEDGDWQIDEDEDEDEDNDYFLTNDGWNSNDSYKINSDGSVTINDFIKIAILKQRDISGEYEYIDDGFSKTLTMPSGSVEYTNLYEPIKDIYMLRDKKRTHGNVEGKEFYTSIGELIENQCGDRWFSGNGNGGVAFAGERDSSGNYKCNPNAKSGKLFEVQGTQQGSKIVSQDGGSWEVKRVNNKDILILNPKKDYGHGDGLDIYAVMDGTLYKGEVDKAGKKEIWHSYNKTALDALKSAVKSGEFLDGEDSGSKNDSSHDSDSVPANELKSILAGEILYEVDSRSNYTSINEVKFDQAMTTITLKEVVGDEIGKGETMDITYGNGVIHFTDGSTTQLKTKTEDYIDLADSDGETTRLYFSLDKAKEYMHSLLKDKNDDQNSSNDELKSIF